MALLAALGAGQNVHLRTQFHRWLKCAPLGVDCNRATVYGVVPNSSAAARAARIAPPCGPYAVERTVDERNETGKKLTPGRALAQFYLRYIS